MKRICLVIALLSLTGCSSVQKWMDAQAWCAAHDDCMAQTKGYAKIGEAVASPFGPLAAAGAGSVLTYLGLGLLGIRGKKKEDPK